MKSNVYKFPTTTEMDIRMVTEIIFSPTISILLNRLAQLRISAKNSLQMVMDNYGTKHSHLHTEVRIAKAYLNGVEASINGILNG